MELKRLDAVTVAQLDAFDEVIDVRSPAEFALDHVPAAVNCPVLDDAERAHVGTLYKEISPFDAKKIGAALVAKNIARHINERFRERDHGWRPLVYCWRGGQRSAAMAYVLRQVGWDAATLAGGYRAYRREVIAQLDRTPQRFRFQVVCGATGSGKSRAVIGRWLAQIDSGAWGDLVADLLLTHYDPSYLRATAQNYLHYDEAQALSLARLDPTEVARAATELLKPQP